MLEILDPTHGEDPEPFTRAPRLAALDGAVVGVVSNGKQGTGPFFAALAEALRRRGAAEVDVVVKANYSAPAERAVMDRAARWHALVSGIGD
ncbi:MAG: hypothetical protein AAF547_16680 [Actinomycetota bacterium]